MEKFKTVFQFSFMAMIVVGLIGIYSELRELNQNMEEGTSMSSHTRSSNANMAHFSSFDLSPTGEIPTVSFRNYGGGKDYKAVPIVIIKDENYTWD